MLENVFLLLGAVALFLYSLKLLSEGVGEIAGERIKGVVQASTSNRVGAVLAGAFCTAIAQSSVATNMIVIAFVKKGIIAFISASAIIMGTNIGTTITAQLVSLSSVSEVNVIAIGSLVGFLGFVFTLQNKQTLKSAGKAMLGFGFLFTGIDLLTKVVEAFKGYAWFTNLFLVKSPLLLILNGFVITAVLQSSSVVTSVMIVLAELGLLSFQNAVFIVLGANVGTCLPVIFASLSMGKESIKCSIFNLTFNLIGCLIFILPLILFGSNIQSFKIFSFSQARAIANFHTLFNVCVCLILLPVLKPVCKLVDIFTDFLFSDTTDLKTKKQGLFIKYTLKRNNK